MTDWTKILNVADLPVGSRKFVEVGDTELAVFHLDEPDRFVVIDNACPHAGGNLIAGEIENDNEILCPWHFWGFDLDTGGCTMNDAVKLQRYETRIEDGCLFARTRTSAG